ncbi:hypothetical protein OIU77_000767 [Salix suchowensis]|uniref:DUF4283 domain-containing protein n=1 Tax=Salix suchowensis TaxID=1278906 RepID=A0ABQ9B9B6_9ROSI|nr:hypothetical protein OIU77_000767 [Salix suchowensis]
MNDIVFVVGASDLSPNGAITGGESEQTHEVRDIGGTASPPPSPPPVLMSFKDKVSADFGMVEDIMVIGDEDYIIQNGKLLRRWKPKELITFIDLENNFLIVKFLLDEDMKYVLIGGPWQFDVLEKINNLIGLTVKVDSHTISQSRRKFAQICVELNISKPLTLFIEVEGRTHGVVYEEIQVICFECRHYGHGRDNCPLNGKVKAQASEVA